MKLKRTLRERKFIDAYIENTGINIEQFDIKNELNELKDMEEVINI